MIASLTIIKLCKQRRSYCIIFNLINLKKGWNSFQLSMLLQHSAVLLSICSPLHVSPKRPLKLEVSMAFNLIKRLPFSSSFSKNCIDQQQKFDFCTIWMKFELRQNLEILPTVHRQKKCHQQWEEEKHALMDEYRNVQGQTQSRQMSISLAVYPNIFPLSLFQVQKI